MKKQIKIFGEIKPSKVDCAKLISNNDIEFHCDHYNHIYLDETNQNILRMQALLGELRTNSNQQASLQLRQQEAFQSNVSYIQPPRTIQLY